MGASRSPSESTRIGFTTTTRQTKPTTMRNIFSLIRFSEMTTIKSSTTLNNRSTAARTVLFLLCTGKPILAKHTPCLDLNRRGASFNSSPKVFLKIKNSFKLWWIRKLKLKGSKFLCSPTRFTMRKSRTCWMRARSCCWKRG